MTKEGTRERILEAAVEEIAEAGFGGARTRSIADRAGVNNALVHYHFSSMEDLLVAAVEEAITAMAADAAVPFDRPALSDGLVGVADVLAATDPTEPRWQVLMEAMLHTRRVPRLAELTARVLEEYRDRLGRQIGEAIGTGALPEETDAEGLALALMALLDGLALHAYVNPATDVHRAGAAIAALLDRGADL